MDLSQLEALQTPLGQQALTEAARLLDGDRLAAASALRARFEPDLAAAALTQATLRAKAVGKFGPAAEAMYFTRPGLEQATRQVVAQRRARRVAEAGVRAIADLGCGLGADLRAFVSLNLRGYAVEADPVTAKCAELNVPTAHVTCGDAQDFDLAQVDAVFCDPARRSGGRRLFRPADYSPPWDWVMALPERVPHTVLKLAPGIDHDLLPAGSELELVSVDGEVVEAAAWCGPFAQVPRRATVIKDGVAHELTGTGDVRAAVAKPLSYVYDPDGAVVRSHLVAEFATSVNGTLADPDIAYVWADQPTLTPFARCFAVREVMPFSLKRLRSALREQNIGRLEILKRGSALDIETLRKDLRLNGSDAASLLLTRISGAPVSIIAVPVGPPRTAIA
ncbi:class I SAM-dependent methyltransferase [Catelliglobosispora koreensis]|uniref:class I SAM-dependent methyltransferase n=1 Tax=Catelliglobosispora koreensis TaxID=129052 RepID=UPI000364BE57|nr:class I SAM-dependent methyltransferase [Catelliglobosispora koreensis]